MQSQPIQNPHYQQNVQHQQGAPPITPQPPSEPVALTQEQAQRLQHIQRFARIVQLPMFPLYTGAEAAKRQQEEQDRQRWLADMAKMKAENAAAQLQLSTMDKVGIQVLGAATGTTFFNIDRGFNALASFATTMDSLNANQKPTDVIIIVRWASPPEAQYLPIIVDVLEIRGIGQEHKGAYCHVKANRDFKVKIGTKYEKKIKKNGKWSKTISGSCAVSIVEKGVGEFPLEMVQSTQMPMVTADWVDVQQRFKKQWIVPS
ncbi:hypothetical protein K458DRAFT_490569 [Lentithecium fluviatile CBS 122367]|uniref:Uncharacterized protein n=1 Tax=Lentithecium fluviatile CBS 122367 TaxID=1168545 RepID=A0A6G1IMK0_9PLEO|nr:hypothetical protein K458DRAFT_490569 [Lentithecium fluviatile CBS 122367]